MSTQLLLTIKYHLIGCNGVMNNVTLSITAREQSWKKLRLQFQILEFDLISMILIYSLILRPFSFTTADVKRLCDSLKRVALLFILSVAIFILSGPLRYHWFRHDCCWKVNTTYACAWDVSNVTLAITAHEQSQ